MERSSEILRGDSIKVTEPSHPAFDFCGQVLDYNAGTCEVKVRLSKEVEGRRVGVIHRSMVTNIHGTRNNTVARSTIATQNHIYLEDFVDEVNLELERVNRYSYVPENSVPDRDVNGRSVFVGDLVRISDGAHDYYEWIAMVNRISPTGLLHRFLVCLIC